MRHDRDLYWEGCRRLAAAVLRAWVRAGKPAFSGERWELFCAVAGVDPDRFAAAVNARIPHPGEAKMEEQWTP